MPLRSSISLLSPSALPKPSSLRPANKTSNITLKMTSKFARNHEQLSEETRDAYRQYGANPSEIMDRVYFIQKYPIEVVPEGVSVLHIPRDPAIYDVRRQEIHLMTPCGRIFMLGIVTRENRHNRSTREASDEAFARWYARYFVPDGQNWRYFTALQDIRFSKSQNNQRGECMDSFNPIVDARYVAAYLQREYDSLRYY